MDVSGADSGIDISGDGGVILETKEPGNGVRPEPGMIVFVQYTGRLTNGTVFDATANKPHRKDIGFYFPLGMRAVIKGWDVGFQRMSVGEKATLTLRYDYAYGEQGMQSSGIPPRATLVFDVELLDAKTMTAEELDELDERVDSLRQ